MLTLTPSLPLPAVSLFMCRHSSAAVMPRGSDCIHWRCWWLPLPSHFFFLLPFQLLHRCVIRCVCGCWWRGRRGCVFHTATPPASCHQLQAGGCLFALMAEGEEGVTFTGCVYGCSSSLLPHAMLCCLLVPAWHVLLTPSHTTTTPVMASWPHCPSSPLPSL